MLAKLRTLALILAFIAAAVPSFMYITDANRDWLWIHIGVNIFAYITVVLTTIQTTLDVAGRDKHKLPVPARFQNNLILAKWWTAVRLSWRWHALAALARVGLAHALAQHIHIIQQTMDDFQGIISPFFTATYFSMEGYYSRTHAYWLAGFIGGAVLVLFSLAETRLITAMTLYVWSKKQQKSNRFIKAGRLRLGLIIVLILFMVGVQKVYKAIEIPIGRAYDDETSRQLYGGMRQYILPPLKVAHRIGFTLLDNGTMMASEIMLMDEGMPRDFTCNAATRGKVYNDYSCRQVERIMHRIFLTGGGLILFAVLARFYLWLAQQRYQQQSLEAEAHFSLTA